eukprot:gnl/TRDRNA2_/TRDRNA2_172985_c0_seq3.p1 gnl/TRDRNA2_/TRDRNA2_172985_c0~~gnl/TRDRNA2_/TRDRNA2_172985_c0_seq3.p1  ORF type:complete len:342 (-),score=76.46 gnl/TRDRNA2_/TRDRNA2_172985_c0_seq3:103-1128(-)
MEVLVFSGPDLESLGMTFEENTACCEEAFTAHGNKTYEMPPKPGVHSMPGAFIHAMPGYLAKKGSGEEKAIGIKWIAGYPDNPKNKLPFISGLMVLNDPKTGLVQCVMDGAFVTNIRTSGATCASFKKLGHKDMSSIALCGTGMQGKWNIIGLSGIMPNLKKIKCFDVFPAAIEGFKKLMAEKLPGVEVVACASNQECVSDVDVIITTAPTTPGQPPIYQLDWVKKGALIFPIHAKGWNPDALKKCDKYIVDDYDQFTNLTGGWYEDTKPYAETGEVINGSRPGRESNTETIICVNTGLGLHDLTTAKALLKMREEKGLNIGQKFTMVPSGPPSQYIPPVE